MAICHPHDIRHQVVWNVIWALSNPSRWMSTDWVEVSQSNCTEFGVGVCVVFHNLLHHGFGLSIWIDGLYFICFCINWILSIHASAAGKYKSFNIEFLHHLKQRNGAADIIVVVLERLLHGVTHCLERSKMNNRFESISGEYLGHRCLILNVDLMEEDVLRLASNFPQSIQGQDACVIRVIDNDNELIFLDDKFNYRVRANVAEAACDQDMLFSPSSFLLLLLFIFFLNLI